MLQPILQQLPAVCENVFFFVKENSSFKKTYSRSVNCLKFQVILITLGTLQETMGKTSQRNLTLESSYSPI